MLEKVSNTPTMVPKVVLETKQEMGREGSEHMLWQVFYIDDLVEIFLNLCQVNVNLQLRKLVLREVK